MSLSTELYCPRCGYDVTGLPQPRCPECGCRFDPALLEFRRAASYRLWQAFRDVSAPAVLIGGVVVLSSRLGASLCLVAPLAVLILLFGTLEASISVATRYGAAHVHERRHGAWWRAAFATPPILGAVLFVSGIAAGLASAGATAAVLAAAASMLAP